MPVPLELIKGQRIKLADLSVEGPFHVEMALSGISGAHFLCVVLGAGGKLLGEDTLIHSGHESSRCGSVSMRGVSSAGAGFDVDCSRLPGEASELVFVVALGESSSAPNESSAHIQEGRFVVGRQGAPVAVYSFGASHFDGEKTIILARLYRKGEWRLALVGSGFRAGLQSCFRHFGIPGRLLQSAPSELGGGQEDEAGGIEGQILIPREWPGSVLPPIPHGLTPAVGFILVETQDGNHATGTGFVINPGGALLTCRHVVVNARSCGIRLEGTQVFRPLKCLAEDEQHDIALLWMADGQGWPYWLPLAARDTQVQLGDPLGLLGYPLGFELGVSVTYTQGIVNSCRAQNGVPLLQIDAGAAPGSSGGPVFRRSDGRVVGILRGGVERHGMLINLAWDIRALWGLISPLMV